MTYVHKCERCGTYFENQPTAYEVHMLRHLLEDVYGVSASSSKKNVESKEETKIDK